MRQLGLLHKTIITLILLVISYAAAYAQHPDLSGGDGSYESPYLITKASDLVAISNYVNTEYDETPYYYKMTADVDMSGIDFVPINHNNDDYETGYGTYFDGDGHKIKNLTIAKGYDKCGLFGQISDIARNGSHFYISNLTIENIDINIQPAGSQVYAGGIVGYVTNSRQSYSLSISNCNVSGSIIMEDYTQACIGGIAGYAQSVDITKCKSNTDINVSYGYVNTSSNNGIGGIVGKTVVPAATGVTKALSECSNYGNITGPTNVGGIAGFTNGICATKDNNSGKITFYDDYAGGIIGYATSTMIDFSCNIGSIKIAIDETVDKTILNTKYVGGIAGYSLVTRTVTAIYPFADNLNAGYVSGWNYTGGICGYSNGWTYNNVNIGSVFDASKYISNCKSSANIACYPYSDGNGIKNDYYGGQLYDKQMSLLKDSMNGMTFDKEIVFSELFTSQMLGDSIYHHFRDALEKNGPHGGEYNWVYNEGVYAVPNDLDEDFNILASAVIKLDTSDRANDVNHQFRVVFKQTDGETPTITSASNNKICKIAGNSVGLVGTGLDTLRLQYKGMVREIPLTINSVDTLMFSGGSGAKDDPYLISCLKDVKELEFYVNKYNHSKYTDKNWSYEKWFKVTEDIDDKFTGGIGIIGTEGKEFQGHFDGNGKRITIEPTNSSNAALINIATTPATISNVEVNGEIYACSTGAAIVNTAKGISIDSCLSTVNIVATDTAGGIVAKAYDCKISNCGNDGFIRSSKLSGGLIGYAENCEINDIANGGSVISALVAGGLVGSSPRTTVSTGVNYGYTGRTTSEIDGTKIGYTIGEIKDGRESNTYWNAQTNTIWDETWVTEGLSYEQMMTNTSFKSSLGSSWNTSSDTTLVLPKALEKFEGKKLMVMPFNFKEKWNTLKDVNDTIKVPGKWFMQNQYITTLGLASTEDRLYPIQSGEIAPQEFGSDTLILIHYYNGIAKRTNQYRKIVPIFISAGFTGEGKGTKDDPYLINNSSDLNKLIKTVNEDYYCVDTLRNASWHKYFKQKASISTITTTIGKANRERYEWNGFYDGNGNAIDVKIEGGDYAGLFNSISKKGTIRNLTITGSIKGSNYCGAIAGLIKDGSSIENCNNKANVEGANAIGGIAGKSDNSSILICYNNGRIDGLKNVGGICGYADNDCQNADLINLGTITGNENVGGITGTADSCDIRRAINVGIVKGDKDLGGIAGRYLWCGASNKFIFECMNYGYADNEAENSGAIVGENVNEGTNITLCFYNNQLTLAKAVNGIDDEGFASGLSTEDLLGNNLDAMNYYLSENWTFGSKQYPMPSALGGEETNVAKAPAFIDNDEIFINIGTEFEVATDNDVKWESSTDNLKIEGNQVSFNHSGIDTLNARINDVVKRQPIFITNGLFSGGNGSENRPYRITCKQDMVDLATYVNTNMLEADKTKNWSDGLYFSLENDIPEDSIITKTIGAPDTKDESNYIHFGGIFEGHGHKMHVVISGEEDNVGLFGYLSKNSVVDSLNIYGELEGTSNVGGFAGYCEKGTISNCTNQATINGNNDAGGICGYITEGTIQNCSNAGDIISRENKAGGIAGETSQTKVEGCSNIAIIRSYTLNSYTGGICGRMNNGSSLSYCLNSGIVIGENRIGGIVGEAENSTINECLVTNEVIRTGYVEGANEGYICGLSTGTTTLAKSFFDNQFCNLEDANDASIAESHQTTELVGQKLNGKLSAEKWIFSTKNYPHPTNDTIGLLASSAIHLIAKDANNNISEDFDLFTYNQCQWKAQSPKVNIKNNTATLLAFGKDTLLATYKDIEKKVAINIQCITLHNLDTIRGCDSVRYEGKWYYEDIAFNDSLKSKETGCDSLVGIKIEIKHSNKAPEQPIIYALGQYNYKNHIYDRDTTVVTRETNAEGCDSVITQTINIVNTRIERDTITPGCDSTLFAGNWFKTDSLIERHEKDEHGRDTLINYTQVLVNYSRIEPTDTIWGYDSVKYEDKLYFNDILISDTTLLETGCDHVANTQIKIGKTERRTINKTYCSEGTLVLSNGKKTVNEDCIVNDTTSITPEKMTIVIYNVSIMHPKDTTIYITNCDTIHFGDQIYNESTQIDSTFETDWCDSTVHYVLKVLKPTKSENTVSDCYLTKFRGYEYTENAVVYDTLKGQNHNGCDSIIVNKIIVKKSSSDTLHTYGLEFKNVYGKHVSNDSTIIDTLTNAAGCDSFLVTKVHITHFVSDTLTQYGCDSLLYAGAWFKKSTTIMTGKYDPDGLWDDLDKEEKKYLQLEQIIHINIGSYQEYITNLDSCDQITFRNKVYTTSTTIRDSFISRSGCDSVMIYNLRLHKPTTEGHLNITGCGIASWNGLTFSADTTIEQHIVTKWGCDSTCIVNIIVRQPDEVTLEEEGCNFVEYDGESYTQDTTIKRVFTNKGGCDSTVYVNIKVYKPSYNTVTYEGEYDVTYNGRKYTRSTVIRDTLVNYHGCDSILTIAIVVTKSLDYPLIVNKYDYMLLCNNNIGSDRYISYQWYKNGKSIYGETKAYYSETIGNKLAGCYQVYVTTDDGREYFSEEVCIEKEKELILYPNPVGIGEEVSINYDFTEKQKHGLYLDVYNSAGINVFHNEPTSYPITIPGQTEKGYYFILITTGEDKNLGTKYIVK